MLSLFGAGVGRDAGIPDSKGMLQAIEIKIGTDEDWVQYSHLHSEVVLAIGSNARPWQDAAGTELTERRRLLQERVSVLNIETYVDGLRELADPIEGEPRAGAQGLLALVYGELGRQLQPESLQKVGYLGHYAGASRSLGFRSLWSLSTTTCAWR